MLNFVKNPAEMSRFQKDLVKSMKLVIRWTRNVEITIRTIKKLKSKLITKLIK